jgi:AcrR family transcriptional regulator
MRVQVSDKNCINKRREQIASVALKLFSKNGYDRTTTADIAKSCGMGPGTVYRYVGSKADMLRLAFKPLQKEAKERQGELYQLTNKLGPRSALRKTIALMLRSIDKTQAHIMFSYHETRNLPPESMKESIKLEVRLIEEIAKLLQRGCGTGDFQVDNINVAAHNILVLAEMWAVRRWYLKEQQSLEEHISTQTNFIMRAVLTDTRGNRNKTRVSRKRPETYLDRR